MGVHVPFYGDVDINITHHFIKRTNTEKSKVTFNRGARAREKRAHTRT